MNTAVSNGKAKGPLGRIVPRQPLMVNADEVIIRQIPVNFVEWDEEEKQVGKRTITSRTPVQRTAEISDYVPAQLYDTFMAMYDQMVALREAAQRAKETATDGQNEQASAYKSEQLKAFQDLQYQLVLAVWQLTEPDMDLERLRQGLEENDLTALFQHFFSILSRQKKNKAKPGADTSSASEQELGEDEQPSQA